jgi:hypothetical protein
LARLPLPARRKMKIINIYLLFTKQIVWQHRCTLYLVVYWLLVYIVATMKIIVLCNFDVFYYTLVVVIPIIVSFTISKLHYLLFCWP